MDVATPVSLKFNSILSANASSSRDASLNRVDGIDDLTTITSFVNISIYVPASNLNQVFTTSGAAGVWMDLSDGNGVQYLQTNSYGQQVSGQPLDFKFDWSMLDLSSKADLSFIQSNVLDNNTNVGNNGVGSGNVTFRSKKDVSNVDQSVKSLLNNVGGGLEGGINTQTAFLGTVWMNHSSDAITNEDTFLVPTIVTDSLNAAGSGTLYKANNSDNKMYRLDFFNQAYDNYKYDVSYNRLSLDSGDSVQMPIQYTVAQTVNYDLFDSAISGGHSNKLLSFVVGRGSNAKTYSVMTQETISGTCGYKLNFIAVGDTTTPTA